VIQPKKTNIICSQCKKPITGARTVIEEKWFCGDCTYKHDMPHVEIKEPERKRPPKLQHPELFDTKPLRRRHDLG
jgi:hypothetical protein